ncbi:hypothetical protein [Cohnella thailandensis]|uniref:Uncharacterized protein n=1 Tax=Cohnella thailandensis TaxID=557557 RepID=A0A841SVT6_9BACL|nr:hypothetical protein [Cohnella thailandensis]MBB6634726.1 hypothetical protein [Cohnella thailandensis]MBP1972718.1 hypothetical protein [Cohnella thailandensis]
MMTEEQLDKLRVDGTLIRVVRDALEMNDIIGFVVAWDDESVLVRRRNRRVVKLSREYKIVPKSEPRPEFEG